VLSGRARKVAATDFSTFDLILAMDRDNLRELERLRDAATARARVTLLREFDPESLEDKNVPDPYYGGPEGFDQVFDIVHRACSALLDELGEVES
jgi:protein-tyrosine phosphatase